MRTEFSKRIHSSVSEKLLIIADDRERDSGIPQLLSEQDRVDVRVRRLRIGDYLVGSTVIVERKTLGDFAASIIDTRLFKQATRMANSSSRPLYIIEGRVSDLRKIGLTRESLQGALISLSLVFGIPVLRSLDAEETSRLLIYTASQLKRVGENIHPEYRRSGKSLQSKKLRVLQTLPGIGPEKAKVLLQEFDSVERCLQASVESLARLPGIGTKTAESIREIVSEEPAVYNANSRDWEI